MIGIVTIGNELDAGFGEDGSFRLSTGGKSNHRAIRPPHRLRVLQIPASEAGNVSISDVDDEGAGVGGCFNVSISHVENEGVV